MAPGFSQGAGGTPPDSQYPNGNGIERTLLTSGGTGDATKPRLLQVPVTDATPQTYHPYQQDALLTKIFSNVTTRSNAFAVFLTVGFFEVNDDTTRPVSLGAELNRSENRHVRHRMFAIVDRTAMTWFSYPTNFNTPAITFLTGSSTQATLPIPPAAQRIDPRTGRPWTIVPGMVLNIDQNTSQQQYAEENVVVTAVDNNPLNPTFTATFTKQHNANAPIKCYGNPGPWQRYDPRQDNQVVPYFSIID
jgi:hypothetical protein